MSTIDNGLYSIYCKEKHALLLDTLACIGFISVNIAQQRIAKTNNDNRIHRPDLSTPNLT